MVSKKLYKITKKIRAGHTKNKYTLIVALTAHMSDEYRGKCLNDGMNEVLHKPLQEKELLDFLAQVK